MSTCTLKRIAVFCGASLGNKPEYFEMAKQLAYALQKFNVGLVYGGAKVGIMGKIADYALAYGVETIGVMPKDLADKQIAHPNNTQLYVTDCMRKQKTLMAELADGFIMLPGGLGSLDEFFENWNWLKMGYHTKPCGILNFAGYFDLLITFLNHITEEGFLSANHRNTITIEKDPIFLIQKFINCQTRN